MSTTSNRRTGRVKFFNSQKGFGFIIPSESTESAPLDEIFVHHTAIHNDGGFKSLAEVEYDLVQGPKGMQAANVTGPNGASVRGDPNLGRSGYGNSGGRFGNGGYTGGGYGGFGGPNSFGGGYGAMSTLPYGQGVAGQGGFNQVYGGQPGYGGNSGGGAGFPQNNNQFQFGYPQQNFMGGGGVNAGGLPGQHGLGQQGNPNLQGSFGGVQQPFGGSPMQPGWNVPIGGAGGIPPQH
ncbi:cold-shock' DNA-binding domain-containing protein [Mortierella sp. GBAus27b]|nr:cold-shock' DNA-binding domain-containing protein [Mortierella sp. GBAus27b]